MCVYNTYVFLEYKTAEEGCGLLGRQVIEEAVEHHLGQEKLVRTTLRQTDRHAQSSVLEMQRLLLNRSLALSI